MRAQSLDGSPEVLDLDPFSRENLADPFPVQRAIRESDSVVRLAPYDVYAVGRADEAAAVFSDHTRFTTTAGVGLADVRRPDSWRVKNPLLEVDPPQHTAIRRALLSILSPTVVRGWKESFRLQAEALVARLLERETFDGVTDLAEAFVSTVFPTTVGIPVAPAKAVLFGNLNFNANGPQNELYWESFSAIEPLLAELEESFALPNLTPGGICAQIYAAEAAGDLPDGAAVGLVRVLLRGGVDTTTSGIGFALRHLAEDPGSMSWLREDPRRATPVFDEALRLESPAQVMFRTTVEGGAELGGHRLDGNRKVAVFIGAANRDPRRWEDPDRFDPARRVSGAHIAFGSGAHACLGLLIAKFEAEALLTALAARVHTLEIVGTPTYRLVNTLRTLDSLPLRAHPN